MRLLLIISFIFIASCASKKDKTQNGYEYDSEKEINIPQWVYSPVEACEEKKYICASAEGKNQEEADVNARKSLASILEVKVHSNYELKRFGLSSLETSGLQEKIKSSVEQQVDIILNGVEIVNRFKKEKTFYSFAQLKKKPVAKMLSQKIKDIDDKLVGYYRQKKAVLVNKMLSLYEKRNALEKQYIIVSGRKKLAPLGYEQIYQVKINQRTKAPLYMKISSRVPKKIYNAVEEILTDMGYRFVNRPSGNSLNIGFTDTKAYLNVKGFQKRVFDITLTSFSKDGVKKGVVGIKKSIVARSKVDAITKLSKSLKEDIEKEIYKLNID